MSLNSLDERWLCQWQVTDSTFGWMISGLAGAIFVVMHRDKWKITTVQSEGEREREREKRELLDNFGFLRQRLDFLIALLTTCFCIFHLKRIESYAWRIGERRDEERIIKSQNACALVHFQVFLCLA